MRYNLNALINQVVARLPDNATGAITASTLRSLLTDFVESLRGASSFLTRQGAALDCALTTVYQIKSALFTAASNSATDEVEGVTLTQIITVKYTGAYNVSLDVTADGASTVELRCSILVNNVQTDFCTARNQLNGAGRPVGLYNAAPIRLNAGDQVALGLAVESGTANVLIGPCAIGCSLIPSRI